MRCFFYGKEKTKFKTVDINLKERIFWNFLCDLLNLSRKTYYKYRNTINKDYNDYLLIKEVFE